jgi:energy-coupling factor transport system ATP-binding protein
MHCIQVENLSYSYFQGGKKDLADITFKVDRGEALGIIGLNGSGKTTLCYCLCGIIPHYLQGKMEGKVLINGKDTRELPLRDIAQEVGIVLQDPNTQLLMPTVEDELAFGLENYGWPRKKIRERIYAVMDLIGIRELKDEAPHCLSGGQKQLVALAAVLALDPMIIVLDEALSMLDEAAVERILRVMERLQDAEKTLIVVDHTLRGLRAVDKIFVLEAGRIIKRGPKDAILRERDFLAQHQIYL